MGITLLPAIDVTRGRTARVGTDDHDTAQSDPMATALRFQSDGATWLHLVDLDAALGNGNNAEHLASIIGTLDIDVQLSAGIDHDNALRRALDTGCARIVLSTAALADPTWCARAIDTHAERISMALDVRTIAAPDGTTHHRLIPRGSPTDHGDLWGTLAHLDHIGCERYIITDTARDGTLLGPNHELYRTVARTTSTPIIASGGIATIDDLLELAEDQRASVEGAIIGRAIHTGRINLPRALAQLHRAR